MSEAIDGARQHAESVSPASARRKVSTDELGLKPQVWRSMYMRRVAATDFGVLVLAVAIATLWRFGVEASSAGTEHVNVSYLTVGTTVVVLWWLALALSDTRDTKIIGEGPDEYRRVARASILVFGWIAIISLVLKFDLSRGYLAIAFPLGTLGLLAGRKYWRRRLYRARKHGATISRVLVIGGVRSAERITRTLHRGAGSGYRVTGVWVPDRAGTSNERLDVPNSLIPVLGTNRTLSGALAIAAADTVIVTDSEHLGHDGLRDLAWQLEGMEIDLLVSPNVIDVAGPRIHVRAVDHMPLIHLEEPQYAGAGAWPKLLFDKVVATIALVLFSPLLLVTAIAVKVTSRGPAFYRQERIGRGGEPFRMIKFRSMHFDADSKLTTLLADQGTADKPLFKVTDDPRVTDVGRFIRRFSIDELPQLFNVLIGDMSLVGPRPQRKAEVDLYDHDAHRRLTVRPGMTGLWQVSGRSDLSWDDAIRLDIYYVENWSMTGDLMILWKTARAVLSSNGAY